MAFVAAFFGGGGTAFAPRGRAHVAHWLPGAAGGCRGLAGCEGRPVVPKSTVRADQAAWAVMDREGREAAHEIRHVFVG